MSVFDTSANAGSSILDPIAATLKNPFSTTVKNNGKRAQDFPGGFQIQEYENGKPLTGTQNYVQLVGNMMPMQPFAWDGEQRLVKEYYPGNPEAAVQVLGAKEGEVTIKGRFKDKHYQDPSYYGASYQYTLLIDGIRKRGNLVHFWMNGTAGSWSRWGFIEKVSFKMNKLSWIDYEITFFVVSDVHPINNYFAAPEKQAPSAINNNLIAAVASFNSSYSDVPTSMPQSISGLLNNLISSVAKNMNLVTNFVGTVINTASSIESSAMRALGLIKNAQATIANFRLQLDGMTHTFNSLSSQGSAAGQTRDTYTNLQYLFETASATVSLSTYLAQMKTQFQALALTVPKARYRVQTGDTLQNISIKFYGVSDYWTDIFDHNQLTSTDLQGGDWTDKPILEIPNV